MLLPADENFPKPIVETLRSDGHDVLWARTDLAGCKDVVLLDLAETEGRIVSFGRLQFSAEAHWNYPGSFSSGFIPLRPGNSRPLYAPLWSWQVSIITTGGIQMVSSRKK